MIREIRKIKSITKQKYIRMLIEREHIHKYVRNGYVAYDPKEVSEFKKTVKLGRPIKIKEGE